MPQRILRAHYKKRAGCYEIESDVWYKIHTNDEDESTRPQIYKVIADLEQFN